MCWRKIVALLKLCNTPATIYSPFPLFAISLFLISHNELSIYDFPVLFAGIVVSWLLAFPSNLWNHCNDLKEDIAAGKKTILTQDISMQKKLFLSQYCFMLFLCSLFIIYLLNLNDQFICMFLIWVIATWWYSDNLILKKVDWFQIERPLSG